MCEYKGLYDARLLSFSSPGYTERHSRAIKDSHFPFQPPTVKREKISPLGFIGYANF
ncbi:unnamed protein product [Bacillus thuringiensis DB27]|uniref:Uncharacterized protein n=1 Tax=Bacillus thuringiensis DB27 TaxID=1431339 RepID=W8ZAR2_BACTU|nr:unnamed protein product [Bacillus thuringiensis DB27]